MIVPACERMPIIRHALESGQHFQLTATGGHTFIHKGDVVELESVDSLPVIGDLLLVQCGSERERYVLHRVVRVDGEMLFVGVDAQEVCDGPFTQVDVLGNVTKSYRNGRVRKIDRGIWSLAGLAWHPCIALNVWLLRLALQFRRDQR